MQALPYRQIVPGTANRLLDWPQVGKR